MRSQQAILAATQFVIDFNKARKAGSDMTRIHTRMQELEGLLEPLIVQSESWPSNYLLTQPVDPYEAVLANSLRCISRIKLNRYRFHYHACTIRQPLTNLVAALESRYTATVLSLMSRSFLPSTVISLVSPRKRPTAPNHNAFKLAASQR